MNEITILWGTSEEGQESTYSFETDEALAAFNLALAEVKANGATFEVVEVDEELEAEITEAIAEAGLTVVEDDEPVDEVAVETEV